MVNQVLDQWDECGQILIGGGREAKKNNWHVNYFKTEFLLGCGQSFISRAQFRFLRKEKISTEIEFCF